MIRISNAQLRYYFKIQDPDGLDDEEWAKLVQELHFIRSLENPESNTSKEYEQYVKLHS